MPEQTLLDLRGQVGQRMVGKVAIPPRSHLHAGRRMVGHGFKRGIHLLILEGHVEGANALSWKLTRVQNDSLLSTYIIQTAAVRCRPKRHRGSSI